jgi:hypothetical protein
MATEETIRLRLRIDTSDVRRKLAILAAAFATAKPVVALRASLAEILTALTFVVGWLLITAGVAHLTSPVAWYFSLGLLALSLGGWKLLGQFVWNGLYALTRDS